MIKDFSLWEQLGIHNAKTSHAHFRDYEQYSPYITPTSSIQEALMWGIVWSVGTMPNTKPALVTLEKMENYYNSIPKTDNFTLSIYAWARDDNFHELEKMIELPYCSGIKIYLPGVTTTFKDDSNNQKTVDIYNSNVGAEVEDLSIEQDSPFYKIAMLCKKYDKVLCVHRENPGWKYEPQAEEYVLEKVCLPLAEKTWAKIELTHASNYRGVEMAMETNEKKNTQIIIGLTPQHTYMNDNNIYNYPDRERLNHLWDEFRLAVEQGNQTKADTILEEQIKPIDKTIINPYGHCFPNVKSEANRQKMVKLLEEINKWKTTFVYWCDHAPHLREFKNGLKWVFGGIPSLRDGIAVMLSAANQTNATLGQIQALFSENIEKVHNTITYPQETQTAVFERVNQYYPEYDYYDGHVENPWKQEHNLHEGLLFKKVD